MKDVIEKHIIYQIQIYDFGKQRRKKIEEFNFVEEAEDYKQRLSIFRPNGWFVIETEYKEVEPPAMGFFDRMVESDAITKELILFKENNLDYQIIENRFMQLTSILNNNRILKK